MITITIEVDLRLWGMIIFSLAMFGVAFNTLVNSLKGKHEGYTSYLVAIGVFVTLCLVAVVAWQAAVIVLCAFTASGLPMIFGEAIRTKKQQANELANHVSQAISDAKDVIGK